VLSLEKKDNRFDELEDKKEKCGRCGEGKLILSGGC